MAREVMFSIPADVVSSSHGVCDGGSCDFGDLAPGTVIQLQLQREVLGGGISARCNGDVFEISGRVTATTNDPAPDNNTDTVSSTRRNGGALISGCPGEGLLQNESGGGGATGYPLLLMLLVSVFTRRSLRPAMSFARKSMAANQVIFDRQSSSCAHPVSATMFSILSIEVLKLGRI